jgi:Phosphotransferase enzyme family
VTTQDRSEEARPDEIPEWTEDRARELAGEVLTTLGVADAQTTLLRFRRAFATLRVARPPLVVKLAAPDSKDALARSLSIGESLTDAGVPVSAPAVELARGPVQVGERWAGLWHWERIEPQPPEPEATGHALRRLHEALADSGIPIPDLDPVPPSSERLTAIRESSALPDSAVDFMAARLEQLSRAWDQFESELGVGPIHGDFKTDNLRATSEGPLILDLDDSRVAPWEWDLATVSRGAHQGWSAEEWPAFSAGYGYDLRSEPRADPLRELTHLGALIFQFIPHASPLSRPRGWALLDEWLRDPERRCYELDWDGAFLRFPDPTEP